VGSVILTGAYAFGGEKILWGAVTQKVVLPLLFSPVAAWGTSYFIFRGLDWLCRHKYCLNCHFAHWMSAITSGFARGLNDTPKIAALALVFYFVIDPTITIVPAGFFLLLAVSNAAGGLLMGLRVTETLAHKVTRMNHLEGFAANLATSFMVIGSAIRGFPVSTTHVSSSAIMGMGLHKGAIGVTAYWLLKGIIPV
jgi:phosphate/sulfate permease